MGTSISGIDGIHGASQHDLRSVDFAADPLSVYLSDSLIFTVTSGTLAPYGYFVISRTSGSSTMLGFTPGFTTTSMILPNSDACYTIKIRGITLDIADDCTGAPASGRYVTLLRWWSMERNNPPGDGRDPSNWHNACLQRGFETEQGKEAHPKYKL